MTSSTSSATPRRRSEISSSPRGAIYKRFGWLALLTIVSTAAPLAHAQSPRGDNGALCESDTSDCRSVTVTKISGDGQWTSAGTAFPSPLEVLVTGGRNNPLQGVTVEFSGTGIVSTSAATNAKGIASVLVTANSLLGGNTVTATVTTSPAHAIATFGLTASSAVACSSSISVTSTAESGPHTLRSALADVCPTGTIDLGPIAGQFISLNSRLYVAAGVSILGQGVTISGSGHTRIFFIQGGQVTLQNLTLANGVGQGGTSEYGGSGAGMGAAIFQNGGSLALIDVNLFDNHATGGSADNSGSSSAGGFAENDSGGDLGGMPGPQTNSVAGSFGTGGAGGNLNGGFGGGAGGAAPAMQGSAHNGAIQPGLAGWGGSAPMVSQIVPASSQGGVAGGSGAAFGGAIFVRAGALSLAHTTFARNTAVGGNGAQGKGGALFLYAGTVLNETSDNSFSANFASSAGQPGQGSSSAPYTRGAACPGLDTHDVCGVAPSNTLSLSVTGAGAVSDSSGIINCPSSYCSATFQNQTVLTAAPAAGATFAGWSGACSGAAMTCTVPAAVNVSVTATFEGGASGSNSKNHSRPLVPMTTFNGTQTGVTTRTLGLPFIALPNYGNSITFNVQGNASGAGGTFPGGVSNVTVQVDQSGFAYSPQLTLNNTSGSFTVLADDTGNGESSFTVNVSAQCVANPVVTSNADQAGDTVGTLRWAVDYACEGSTITFNGVSGVISLVNRLRIDDDITIQGPGAASLAIDGQSQTRLFFIGAGNVNISGLTLQNGLGKGPDAQEGGGAAGMGGAIFQNGGSLSLSSVNFTNNKAQGGSSVGTSTFGGAGFGGGPNGNNGGSGGDLFGIGGDNGGTASGGPGAGAAYGGYDTNPTAGFGGGGAGGNAFGQAGFGGGAGSQGSPGYGGGGPGLGNAGGGGAGLGGAIFAASGSLSLNSVQFTGNSAVGGSGSRGSQSGQGKGGSIFLYSGVTATESNTRFSGSVAANATQGGSGTSATPYVSGALCPGYDDADICGSIAGFVAVTFQTSPAGLNITLDGATYATPVTVAWNAGESHTIAANPIPINGGGSRYGFSAWSDNGALSHSYTVPASPATVTATFKLQYQVTATSNVTGMGVALAPPSTDGYYDPGTMVQFTAVPAPGTTFSHWTGQLSGSVNPSSLTISGPTAVNAVFTYAPFTGCYAVPANLTAWWRAEGNANDVTGNYNGTQGGDVGFAPGKVGQAFSFDGTQSPYVAIPSAVFPFPSSSDFTFETWFKTSAGGVILGLSNDAKTIAPYGSDDDLAAVPAVYVGNDGVLRVLMFGYPYIPAQPAAISQVNDGQFHHVAVAYSSGYQLTYLDGNLVSTQTLSQTHASSHNTYQLGTGYTTDYNGNLWPATTGGWYTFNGLIDEPAVYSRALSAVEITQIYAAAQHGKCYAASQITVQTNPSGGPITVDGNSHTAPQTFTWNAGETHIIAAGAQTGSLFSKWSDGSTANPYSYVVPSGGATLTANYVAEAGPMVTTNPMNVTAVQSSVAQFTAAASGTPAPTVQWQVSTDGGTTFNNINAATSTTLLVNSLTMSENGYQYRAVFTNGIGMAATSAATLRVYLPMGATCIAAPAGLAAWYRAENNAIDVTGVYNGTLGGNTSFTSGYIGKAFSFDGNNSYVQIPSGVFPWPNAGAFSFEAWFKTTTGGTILGMQPAGTPYSTPPHYTPGIYVGTDGKLYSQMFYDGSIHQSITIFPVNDGSWHHVAVAYDGTSEVTYVDGGVVGTQPVTPYADGTPPFYFQLGTGYTNASWPHTPGGWYTFNGQIDEAAIYSNALSSSDVTGLVYAATYGKCLPSTFVTVTTNPPGLRITVDNINHISPHVYQWIVGDTHTIAVDSTAPNGTGSQYAFANWSDGGAISHTYSVVSVNPTVTATYNTQYQLTTQVSPSIGGTVSPQSGSYYNAGTAVPVTATPNQGWMFAGWSNNVINSTVTMNSPQTVTASFSIASLNTCIAPPSNIVAWYRGENDASDLSFRYSGTLGGDTSFAAGKVGQAFSFDGTQSPSVQIPSGVFPWPSAGAFSFEAWFKTTTGGGILGLQPGGTPYATPPHTTPGVYVGSDGKLYAQMFWDGTVKQSISSSKVNDGAWHHVAVAYDGTNEVTYLDGTAIGTQTINPFQDGTPPFFYQLGTAYTGPSWPNTPGGWYTFNGQIDEATIYSRALTSSEVFNLVAADSYGKCVPAAVTSISPNAAGAILNNPTINVGYNTAVSGAASPGNYLLVMRTDGQDPKTSSCSGGLAPGDSSIGVNSGYNAYTHNAAITGNPSMPGDARLKLIVCGANIKSNGNSLPLLADVPGMVFGTGPVLNVSSVTDNNSNTIAEGGSDTSGPTSLTANLNAAPVASTVSSSSVKLFGGTIGGTGCSTTGTAISGSVSSTATGIVFTPSTALTPGPYRLVVCGTVLGGNGAPLGATLDGNNLPGAGVDFVRNFSVNTPYTNVTSSVTVTSTGLILNRVKKQDTETITITNKSGQTISGPIEIVMLGLPAGVTGGNNTGAFQGNPYWTATASSLANGASVQVPIVLNNPNLGNITASTAVYSGSLQ